MFLPAAGRCTCWQGLILGAGLVVQGKVGTAAPPSLPGHAGFASHGVFVNPEKTKLSFALQLAAAGAAEAGPGPARQPEVVHAAVWRSGDGATFVKWCGLLINTATLELQGDYTRCPPCAQPRAAMQLRQQCNKASNATDAHKSVGPSPTPAAAAGICRRPASTPAGPGCCRYAGEHVSTALTLPLRRRPGLQVRAAACLSADQRCSKASTKDGPGHCCMRCRLE